MLLSLKSEDQVILNNSIKHDWSVPEYKLKHFIGNSQIHPLHKIKQYLMELNSRQESCERFEYDINKMQLEKELEEEYESVAQFEAEKKLHQLEANQKEKQILVTKEKFRHALAERDKILKVIKEFNNSEEGIHSDGRLYMDILHNDPVECERIEKKYWEYRLAKQAALDMIAYGRIGVGNMDAIMQLGKDSQNKCIAMAYEVLISNEHRMNLISDKVQEKLASGDSVSDINKLLNMEKTQSAQMITNQENNDAPLIQKR